MTAPCIRNAPGDRWFLAVTRHAAGAWCVDRDGVLVQAAPYWGRYVGQRARDAAKAIRLLHRGAEFLPLGSDRLAELRRETDAAARAAGIATGDVEVSAEDVERMRRWLEGEG